MRGMGCCLENAVDNRRRKKPPSHAEDGVAVVADSRAGFRHDQTLWLSNQQLRNQVDIAYDRSLSGALIIDHNISTASGGLSLE